MTDRELMQMALDALIETVRLAGEYGTHLIRNDKDAGHAYETIEALRARLAQLEACIVKGCSNHRGEGLFVGALCSPCHTFITTGEGKYSQAYRNSQREWQGLTDEEIDWLWGLAFKAKLNNIPRHFARMVEEKLKEQNT